jgi:uncharacterized protein
VSIQKDFGLTHGPEMWKPAFGKDSKRRTRLAMNEIDRKMSAAPSCPICGKPVEPEFKPFCSKRCSDIDLNRWLSGVYAVPANDDEDEDGERPAESSAGEE